MTKTVTLLQDAKDENNVQRKSGDSFACSDSFAEFLANANIATYPTSNLQEVRLSADGTALVSGDRIFPLGDPVGAGNQPSATLAATTGTPGQIVRLSDGADAGALLVWAIPAGSSSYTWCWWLWPQSAY